MTLKFNNYIAAKDIVDIREKWMHKKNTVIFFEGKFNQKYDI